jgi:hypothetical protein
MPWTTLELDNKKLPNIDGVVAVVTGGGTGTLSYQSNSLPETHRNLKGICRVRNSRREGSRSNVWERTSKGW